VILESARQIGIGNLPAPIEIAFQACKTRVSAIFLGRAVEPLHLRCDAIDKNHSVASIELHHRIATGRDMIPRSTTHFAGDSRIALAADSVVSVTRFGASRPAGWETRA
jgi:hypothetical protein